MSNNDKTESAATPGHSSSYVAAPPVTSTPIVTNAVVDENVATGGTTSKTTPVVSFSGTEQHHEPEDHYDDEQQQHDHHDHDHEEEYEEDDHHHDHHHHRDPFFACIPQVAHYFGGIITNEINHVKDAIVGFPTWSKQYSNETYTFYKTQPRILFDEILSGFTVAIMQVPESIAFSFVAGVPPLSGPHATFWMATLTGLLGGKPGMISGAAGALAVVLADLTSDVGPLDYLQPSDRLKVLYLTMFVCGFFQIGFAMLRLATLVRIIPETGMIGFMNGLAIIIFLAQLPAFQYCDTHELFMDCAEEERQWLTFANQPLELVLILIHVAACMAIMKFFPKVPKVGKFVPASLVGLLVGTLIEHTLFRQAIGTGTRTVEETAPLSGTLPVFSFPSMPDNDTDSSKTTKTILVYAIQLATIGAIEGVLTLQACNEITDTVPTVHDSNQELFAQGLGNTFSGMFQAMGGGAMIGQSTINIMNGARHRVSSTSSGIFMLLFVVALSPAIDIIPIATLTGVLFMVVLSTFQWKTFIILRYGRLSDSISIVLVTVVAVLTNLAIAIAAGVIFSALVHSWDSGSHIDADIVYKPMIVNGEVCDVKYVHLKGAVFFSSARKFIQMFSVSKDPNTVIIDFKDALVIDHSAVAAIQGISHRFAKKGKRVLLTNLPRKSHGRLHRTGDHDMLRNQITHQCNLQDSEHASKISATSESDEESPPAARTISQDSNNAAATPIDRVDEFLVGEKLSHLHMFEASTQPVETELENLLDNQHGVTIHSLRKDQ